ncbi:Na+/H+ antiporter subunit E [Streptomyces radicis]|uniref:Na+/H+ antiporter subunit E n=1 Tax=Streptomyces radicis TaxID=1750517 RepID=A0A3A9WIN5_9ACTN|nr:Na+/H+ antiporter subunit E [Streptomyces radicis]RKN07576.1 Na+/H+ antiporter subunit E [Streptomyces radicis]RKN18299.1 Na+/H+ antiporter subunit E [Streptomyces radicis]
MTPANAGPGQPRRPRRPAGRRLLALVWLWLLWIMLWGSLRATVVVGGLLVAVGVLTAFRMPPMRNRLTLRPLRLVRLTGHMLVDLAVSAVSVGWAAVRHGPRAPAAVIEVELAENSDLLIATTAYLTTMTPGTLVLEIDRERRLLYVHALPVPGQDAVDAQRRAVSAAERVAARAIRDSENRRTF